MAQPLEALLVRTPRQQELMDAAAQLFAEHGYHAVGVSDISGALKLSGPAFYRHFRSKELLLVAVLEDAIVGHLQEVGDIARLRPDAREVLEAIIANHVQFVLDQSANIVIWRTEFRSLPFADRHRLRYLQRLYTEEWVYALRRQRPNLDAEQVRTMCHAAIALIQSWTEFASALRREDVEPMLVTMALHVLLESPVEPLRLPRAPEAEPGRRPSQRDCDRCVHQI